MNALPADQSLLKRALLYAVCYAGLVASSLFGAWILLQLRVAAIRVGEFLGWNHWTISAMDQVVTLLLGLAWLVFFWLQKTISGMACPRGNWGRAWASYLPSNWPC
ncbi:MAG: hypothetical protein HC802_00030 [Caldilineaceae bacterium]|nr:hypothetical protein [Caldilineaceae bacterium]